MAKENNILSWENRHLTLPSIESYNSERLSELDMHKAERHILNCDLCADALEGYGQKAGNPKVRKNLETLRLQIRQRSERRQKSGSSYKTWGIAAAILIVLGVGLYYIQSSFLQTSDEPQVAMQQEQTKELSTQELSNVDDLEPADEGLVVDEELDINESPATTHPASGQALPEQASQTQDPVLASTEPIKQKASEPELNQPLASGAKLPNESEDIQAEQELGFFEPPADAPDELDAKQTDVVAMTDEHLEEVKQATTELAQSSVSGGGPELVSSTRLSSGAKLGGSIMDSDPEPEIGFAEYGNYLQNNLQYPEEARLNNVSGVVKVGFILKPGSSYSKFRIVEGLGYGCDKEAERLIQEGPNWKPAVRKGLVTKEEVIVEIKFEL